MGQNGETVEVAGKSKAAEALNAKPEGNALNDQALDLMVGHRPGNQIEDALRANGVMNVGIAPKPHERTVMDDLIRDNRLARLGVVTVEGAGYAVPGMLNAAVHDLTHLDQTLGKAGMAVGIGVAMRVALPKAGAARAAAATAFTYFMARDAAVPVGKAFSDVWDAESHKEVNLAAQQMGDGLGLFAWDAYWGMKLAVAGERGTEKALRGIMGEKSFNRFEGVKSDFLGSDKFFFGRHLNRAGEAVNRGTTNLADALAGRVKVAEKPKMTFDEMMAKAKESGHEHDLYRANQSMHKHGVRTPDGKEVGYSESIDVWLAGKDPRRLTSTEVRDVLRAQQEGFKFAENEGTPVAERPVTEAAGKGKDAPAAPTEVKGSTPELAARIEAEVSPRSISELGQMAKKEMGKLDDQGQQVVDLVEGSIGPVHAAINPQHKALDPGYREWLNQMIALGNEVGGDTAKLQQVAPLFFRGRDAAIGQMSADLGPTGRNVHSLNMFSLEMYTGLKQRMTKAGIDANEVLAAKNPPLNLVARDGGAGPHTIPEIQGVWDVDLVHWPRNMQDLRMLRAGINGHENKHDQFGGILRFANSIREQVIGETVGKALGDKATQMVEVPGFGQMSKQDLIVNILKAQANENTADIGGAAHTGPSGALALGVLLQGLRQGGKLETRNVFGKEMANAENPMGIEVHAMDVFRPKLVAEVLRQRAEGDPMILEYAKQLDAYAEAASRGGKDYVWAAIDHPGKSITIPRAELDAVIPHLVRAQLNTPLEALQGKTYAEVLPHLPTEMKRMDALAEMMVDAVSNNRPLESLPFNTADYTMIQLQSAAMPAALRLMSKGMPAEKVNVEINRVSDYLELQFHKHGDPHIDPLVPKVTVGQIILNPALAARQTGKGLSSVVERVRDWEKRDSFLAGYGGMAIGRDMFSTYQPGSTARAMVSDTSGQQASMTGATTDGAAVQGDPHRDRKGHVIELPTDKVIIPAGVDGPSGKARTIPAPVDAFKVPRRSGLTLDLNEMRALQRQTDALNNKK